MKVIEIDVTKTLCARIYVEVPDDFDMKKDVSKIPLDQAIEETVDKYDWEPYGHDGYDYTRAVVYEGPVLHSVFTYTPK